MVKQQVSYWKQEVLSKSWVLLGIEEDPFWMYKGAGHKYTARLNNKNPPPKYKYVYGVPGEGIVRADTIHVGARFQGRHEGLDGHFNIESVDQNTNEVTVKHDETGKKFTMSKLDFRKLIHTNEGKVQDKIKEKTARLFRNAEAALEHGKDYHKKKQMGALIDHVVQYYSGQTPMAPEIKRMYDLESKWHESELAEQAQKQKKKPTKKKKVETSGTEKKPTKKKKVETPTPVVTEMPQEPYTKRQKEAYYAPPGSTNKVTIGHGIYGSAFMGVSPAERAAKVEETRQQFKKGSPAKFVWSDEKGNPIQARTYKKEVTTPFGMIKKVTEIEVSMYDPQNKGAVPHRDHKDAYDFNAPISQISESELEGALHQLNIESLARSDYDISGDMSIADMDVRGRAEVALLTGITLFTAGSVATVRNPEKYDEDKKYPVPGANLFSITPEKADYQIAHEIMKRLSHRPLGKTVQAVRGMALPQGVLSQIQSNLKKGKELDISLGDISSWTYSTNMGKAKGFAESCSRVGFPPVILQMSTDRGTDVTNMSRYQSEKEIVIGGNVRVKKIKKEFNTYILDVELLPEESTSKSFWLNFLRKASISVLEEEDTNSDSVFATDKEIQLAFDKQFDKRTFTKRG